MKTTALQSLLSDTTVSDSPRRRKWEFATYFPWLLLIGFLFLIALLFGEHLLPARKLFVEKVVTVRSGETSESAEAASANSLEVDPWSANAVFQASGWVEPDPLPTKATALVNGVVETVQVLEGETVAKGQVLATLIQEDFELDLETARSEVASLKSLFEGHESAIEATIAKLETRELEVKAGHMRCLELIDERDRLKNAGEGAVAKGELVNAALRLQTHETQVSAMEASVKEIRSDLAKLEALRSDFTARIRKAETEVARRELALDRTEIRSPVDGIVLRLLVSPGQKRMLDMDDLDSATVVILYQPGFLQARIDVPLEEASRLSVGQAVRIRSNFLPDRIFEGSVTRIVGEADLQRNTLQAKVKFHDPDPRLRPDMLCRGEFLAVAGNTPGSDGTHTTGSDRVHVYVPESALVDRTSDGAAVWTLDQSGKRSELRRVTPGPTKDGFVRITDGLLPGEFVIPDPPAELEEGERIKVSKKEEA
ncbi:MAG: efflux RND transporter periplasmic adaptor subunit [Verrucomicrobiota bacterium]